MTTSAQVVETSVTTTDNSPSQDYTHPDDQTTLLHVTPGFKPFTVLCKLCSHSTQSQQLTLKQNSDSGCWASSPGVKTAPLICPNVTVSPGLRLQVSATLMSFTYVPLRLVSEIEKVCFPELSSSVIICAWSLDIITLFFLESRKISDEGFLPTTVISLLILKTRVKTVIVEVLMKDLL